jgi:hypothetical protein
MGMSNGLTERERLVLAWDKSPEEWEDEYGGQYGAELVDAERKRDRIGKSSMTKARRGFNMLLRNYPDAEVATIWNQDKGVVGNYVHPEVQERIRMVAVTPGPWTCVDLLIEGELKQFAIWNNTGHVYRIGKGGAVEDDPFLKIRELPGGNK